MFETVERMGSLSAPHIPSYTLQAGIKKGDIEINDGLKERFFGSEHEFSKEAYSELAADCL